MSNALNFSSNLRHNVDPGAETMIQKAVEESRKYGLNMFEMIIYAAARARNIGCKAGNPLMVKDSFSKNTSKVIHEISMGKFTPVHDCPFKKTKSKKGHL